MTLESETVNRQIAEQEAAIAAARALVARGDGVGLTDFFVRLASLPLPLRAISHVLPATRRAAGEFDRLDRGERARVQEHRGVN